MKVILASNNKNKLREFTQILSPLGCEVVSQAESGIDFEAEEAGETFVENAICKAEPIFKMTGCGVIADDSGLVVDALGGEPGIYSARYGGDRCKTDADRVNLLLENMKDVPDEKRTARFVCVIHFITSDGLQVSFSGECEGKIGYEPMGENGFGYDPVFMYGDKSFAQISADIKNKVSHRALALKKFVEWLENESNCKR